MSARARVCFSMCLSIHACVCERNKNECVCVRERLFIHGSAPARMFL